MKYYVATIKDAEKVGISRYHHMVSEDGEILLNEMELNICSMLSGSIEERAEQLKAKVLSATEATDYKIKNEFEICSRQQ